MAAIIPLKKVIRIPVAETIQNMTVDIKGETATTLTSRIAITDKREVIVGRITHRGGPTITAPTNTRPILPPGVPAPTRGGGKGGVPAQGVTPAVAPLQ